MINVLIARKLFHVVIPWEKKDNQQNEWDKRHNVPECGRDLLPCFFYLQVSDINIKGYELAGYDCRIFSQEAVAHHNQGSNEANLPIDNRGEYFPCFFRRKPLNKRTREKQALRQKTWNVNRKFG